MTALSDNRLATCFNQLKTDRRKAFVVYLCAGDPNLDTTVELVVALAEAGVDVIELGLPYSDPMADGPAIQLACERALAAGATVTRVLDAVRRIRERTDIPILFFTYVAPVMAYGVERFARDAVAAGADGVLPLDLPPEEDFGFLKAMRAGGLANVCLVAPNTTSERREMLAATSRGFVYYICRFGVTGERSELPRDLGKQVRALKRMTDIPICIGFGISSPELAAAASKAGDGAVVGSHIVRMIEEHADKPDLVKRVARRAEAMAKAVHAV